MGDYYTRLKKGLKPKLTDNVVYLTKLEEITKLSPGVIIVKLKKHHKNYPEYFPMDKIEKCEEEYKEILKQRTKKNAIFRSQKIKEKEIKKGISEGIYTRSGLSKYLKYKIKTSFDTLLDKIMNNPLVLEESELEQIILD